MKKKKKYQDKGNNIQDHHCNNQIDKYSSSMNISIDNILPKSTAAMTRTDSNINMDSNTIKVHDKDNIKGKNDKIQYYQIETKSLESMMNNVEMSISTTNIDNDPTISDSIYPKYPMGFIQLIRDNGDYPPPPPSIKSDDDSNVETNDDHEVTWRSIKNRNHHSLPTIQQAINDCVIYHGGHLSYSKLKDKKEDKGIKKQKQSLIKYNNTIEFEYSSGDGPIELWMKEHRRLLINIMITFFYILILIVIAMGIMLLVKVSKKVLTSTSNSVGGSTNNIFNDAWNNSIMNNINENTGTNQTSRDLGIKLIRIVDYLSTNNISTSYDLLTDNTTQNAALRYMVQYYNKSIPLPSEQQQQLNSMTDNDINEFIQTYIMIVFYYSLHGEQWYNDCSFLSKTKSICDWHFNGEDTITKLQEEEDNPLRLRQRRRRMQDLDSLLLSSSTISDNANNNNRFSGIQCNDQHEIIYISFPSNHLNGTIPSEIGKLNSLQHLSLYNNNITGTLPNSMTELSNSLYFLQLESNHLHGTIPNWLHELAQIQYLGLSHNEFTGIIPKSINQLSLLIELDLSHNQLSGPIDLFDDDISSGSSCPGNLKVIYLHENNLNGEITNQTFYNCQQLQEINLSKNRLVGYFPHHFYNNIMVNLDHNRISDIIPDVTTYTSQIEFLSLSNNLITGSIPLSIYLLKNLIHLDLSSNQIHGEITDVLDMMHQIEYLYLSNNTHISPGKIPYFKDAINLKHLSLSQTNRIGTIPTWLGSISSLTLLDLQSNMLNGTIPSQIGTLQNIQYLFLNNNSLTGTIPTSFRELSNSKQISLDSNSFNGSLESIICDTNGNFLNSVMQLHDVSADCYSVGLLAAREVTCSCCTTCCYSIGIGHSTCAKIRATNSSSLVSQSPMAHTYASDNLLYIEHSNFS